MGLLQRPLLLAVPGSSPNDPETSRPAKAGTATSDESPGHEDRGFFRRWFCRPLYLISHPLELL